MSDHTSDHTHDGVPVDDHLVDDVMGTLHALPYLWDLLLRAVGEAGEATLPHATATLDALAPGANSDSLTLAQVPARLQQVVPSAAAGVRGMTGEEARTLLARVETAFHHAGRAVADRALPSGPGAVVAVNASGGGVPKRSIGSAEVGVRGLASDRQDARRHHGKPMQALCLWSSEVIAGLQVEGHPIAAGNAGENLTVSGLGWATMRPGVRLRIGSVLAQTSAPATPCQKNARWFVDGAIERMDHERNPGWSRWYAWVLEPGAVTEGARVIVEPA